MSRSVNVIAALLLAIAGHGASAQPPQYSGIGRAATDAEVRAWDIDVRPDFKGLPPGSGTVARGMQVWEGKCASCHGFFGESNEVFTPIVGGTTPDDIKTGRVAALTGNTQPQRSTMMKLATVSTLWDYINRAMPWSAPKTLSTEEVYAVTAYILNMAEVLPADYKLSNKNIAEVQQRMPNRNGMTTDHGMWKVDGKPDVKSVACMKDCAPAATITSTLPPAARNVHGNLAQQNRTFGPVRGVDTTRPAATAPLSAAQAVAAPVPAPAAPADAASLAKQNACIACHGVSSRIVGPGFNEIAAKYSGDKGAQAALVAKVRNGTAGVWGPIPMPAQGHIPEADIKTMVQWILQGAK